MQFTRGIQRQCMHWGMVGAAVLLLAGCGGGGGGSDSSSTTPSNTGSSVAALTLRVHYARPDGAYTGWGVYSWQGSTLSTPSWPANTPFNSKDSYGVYVDMPVDKAQTAMSFLLTDGAGNKNCGSDQNVSFASNIATVGQEVWFKANDCTAYTTLPGAVNLGSAKAIWLDASTLVWPGASAGNTYSLAYSAQGTLAATSSGVANADASLALTVASALPSNLASKFPQYASNAVVLTLPASVSTSTVQSLLTDEVAVLASDSAGKVVDGTQVQLAPVLDALYGSAASTQTMGLSFNASDVPTFRLWAPTAKSVTLNVYASATATTPSTYTMQHDAASGVWSYTAADASWTNSAYYTYTVQVYSRAANSGAGALVTNTDVSDPYALSLNANGVRGMVINLADATTAPSGWASHVASGLPAMLDPVDSSLYELHVRDFSANDSSVVSAQRGKFGAFAAANAGVTNGMKHLQALATAGLTHVHIMPAFDFSSVNDSTCANPSIPASTGADLAAATAAAAAAETDCFNWGYDPRHYGAPAGSYSSNPDDGLARVREFRQMVQGLHAIGLRVVMDVVYNHTTSSGQDKNSVLDKIVPGYYQRLDASGSVRNASCCSDTATENTMMNKLMQDTLKVWANQYKVDGFRFDIMGLIPKQAMTDAQSMLNGVALADGRRTSNSPAFLMYGEGWSQQNLSFAGAQQSAMAGTGIGTFNDRLRDAVRGGGPFDSGNSLVANQGFISGLCYGSGALLNGITNTATCDGSSKDAAWPIQNRISVSLAGNLADFPLNASTTGAGVDYFGSPAGYAIVPQDNIAYVSVHDNETLWDISQYKHPVATSTADRARAHVVGLSTVALAQGVPFFHAGDEFLRSKSADGNSYNSGDYFNRIDWTGASNNWAVGLPIEAVGTWSNTTVASAALAQINAPSVADIANSEAAFEDFLKLRKDTSMFRLKTTQTVKQCVSFPDQNIGQVHGLIVMQISGAAGCGDQKYKNIIVLINANSAAQSYKLPAFAGAGTVALHPVQSAGHDAVVKTATFTAGTGTFSVPARTTAVFVQN
ncbi:pullulanase-type alpha-1,6-glucosidase [Uliginosibacterium gangwonense]|uniref:pullulanase-type alpha-1,6-glucosidase n=1 Tax=Uliginosibacterium gangwonense TaxID=392736 RepID=UPI00146A0568|nr:pullulanase-type alpha-1,6-glucosidase [Uliginosibacterium gangwonense]